MNTPHLMHCDEEKSNFQNESEFHLEATFLHFKTETKPSSKIT